MTAEDAKTTLDKLGAKLVEATDRAVGLQTERRSLAYAANTGDHKARKALDAANAQSATADLEIENIKSAIDEARRRLAEAERDEQLAGLRANAQQALTLADLDTADGVRLRDLMADACATIRTVLDRQRIFRSLGAAAPDRLMMLAFTRSILAQLRDAGIDVPLIAPGHRHPLDELVAGGAARVRNWAAAVLDEKAEAA
jgi:hypothetical protein